MHSTRARKFPHPANLLSQHTHTRNGYIDWDIRITYAEVSLDVLVRFRLAIEPEWIK